MHGAARQSACAVGAAPCCGALLTTWCCADLGAAARYVTDADEYRDPGTTAVTLLVTETHLVFSNLGDSRAVLSRAGEEVSRVVAPRAGAEAWATRVRSSASRCAHLPTARVEPGVGVGLHVQVFSTKDHKPGDEREQSRIEQAGGWVVNGRICRLLAVARVRGPGGGAALRTVRTTACSARSIRAQFAAAVLNAMMTGSSFFLWHACAHAAVVVPSCCGLQAMGDHQFKADADRLPEVP